MNVRLGTNKNPNGWYTVAGEEFEPQLVLLRTLIETDIKTIEEALEQAGGPWPPGGISEWKKQ